MLLQVQLEISDCKDMDGWEQQCQVSLYIQCMLNWVVPVQGREFCACIIEI